MKGQLMKPEHRSHILLGTTRSKAKMYEYEVPEKDHIKITGDRDPAKLFTLSIGLIGNFAACINRKTISDAQILELQKNLHFSAYFFDAYLKSQLNKELDPYLILLGSASYYLCDLPGSSTVLAKYLGKQCPDLEGEGLEYLLCWLLRSDLSFYFNGSTGMYGKCIDDLSRLLLDYSQKGIEERVIWESVAELRHLAYEFGNPRQLLFADIIGAIVKRKVENSPWSSLPRYSGLDKNLWSEAIQKDSFTVFC
jgi:POLQ-like helicase